MSGRLRCKPNNRELRCEASAGGGSKNSTKWDDALEPGRSSRRYLLACGARVHVDFHANRHLNDLRCFPGHQRTPSSRQGCRINMVRPHRKGRKPASTKHPWGRIFANWDACLSSGYFHFNTPGPRCQGNAVRNDRDQEHNAEWPTGWLRTEVGALANFIGRAELANF